MAAPETAAPPRSAVVTSVRQFWQIPPEVRHQVVDVALEFTVAYYDPLWSLFWAQGDDGISWIICGSKELPIRAGQRILITGRMSPAGGLSMAQAGVQVLEEGVALPAPRWIFAGTKEEAGKQPTQWVTLEGFVNREAEIDPAHLLLDMTVDGWPVQARILTRQRAAKPAFEGRFVRVRGLLVPNATPAGDLSTLAFWIPGIDGVTVTGSLDSDSRFDRPIVPMDQLPRISAGECVRVSGMIRDREPGRSLTIRDDTGQVVVLTGQVQPLLPNVDVEAIGYPAVDGTVLYLHQGLVRPLRRGNAVPVATSDGLPKLRLAEQILELGSDLASHAFPVQLFGIVTWASPGVPFCYVNDASGGVRISLEGYTGKPFVQGNTVTVDGASAAGEFAPEVKANAVTVEGSLAFPEARVVTLEQAMTGVEEGQWIELDGYLREVGRDGPWARLLLTTSAGEFTAYVPPADELKSMRGSVLRVQGVCSAVANERRQLVGIRLWVPAVSNLHLSQPMPIDPFSVPVHSIASLRQFSTLPAFNRRVRVAGVVLYQSPGYHVYLQDGTESLLVLSQETEPLAPGDRIEAVGFPGREGSRVVLREAVYRRLAGGGEAPPVALDRLESARDDLDGRLVRITAMLLDSSSRERDSRLVLQSGAAIFEAVPARGARLAGSLPKPGSLLALVGVYQVDFDEYRHPRGFRLQLRSAADIEVLRRPPWWDTRRALTAFWTLLACSLAVVAWVATLRRRVRLQTGQIREQVQREARLQAELARSAKLESLGVLAGGIAHDFNNLLTVIMGNVTLARLDAPNNKAAGWLREAEKGVIRARDLTLQLLTFAKGGDPVRKAAALADIVSEAATFALHGANVRCDFALAPSLWPADVDKGQIGQVVHNIVINAVQAMPEGGVVRISLENEAVADGAVPGLAAGRYLKLSIADTGPGIDPATLPRIFDPYFTTKAQGNGLGLATVYSIIKKHAGRIDVESTVNRGTTFHVWLPAAEQNPVEKPLSEHPFTMLSGRVLLMDDEEGIRRSAAALLQRLGLETRAVSDGSEAVREYEAARAAGRPFDLVILDLTVPGGMGGRETVARLRQIDPAVKAVVSSGYSGDPVLARYKSFGFSGIVSKPYDLTELTKALNLAMADGNRN